MKTLTDQQIRELIYIQTHQETGREVELFINGAIWYRNYISSPLPVLTEEDNFIFERVGNDVYKRPFGSNGGRVLIKTLTDEDILDRD